MKKIFNVLFALLVSYCAYSQRVIENPKAVINSVSNSLLIDKELEGNWFNNKTAAWKIGFYDTNVVYKSQVWQYENVSLKKGNGTVELINGNKKIKLLVKKGKKGTYSIGEDPKSLTACSNTVENIKVKSLADDMPYELPVFKVDSATYSGYIKGYNSKTDMKTGIVYVDDAFTGRQDSNLFEINENGSFSVKIPVNHPRFILVNLMDDLNTVFVEPGKEIFQLIDKNKFLFMGDCARTNTDLSALDNIGGYNEYNFLRPLASEMDPEAYKQKCLEIKDKELEALHAVVLKQLISEKAFQLKKLNIEFMAYEQILVYEMYTEDNRNESSESNSGKDYELKKSYYDFITESVLNNQLGILTNHYESFINYLMYNKILRPKGISFSYTLPSEKAEFLQKSGITLSAEELEMITFSKKVEESIIRYFDFYNANMAKLQKFEKDHEEFFNKFKKDHSEEGVSLEVKADYLKTQGVTFTQEEKQLIEDFKAAQLSKEEIAFQKEFIDKYGKISDQFNEKYQEKISIIADQKEFQELNDRLSNLFSVKESFLFDVITLQKKLNELERNFTPYTDFRLQMIQQHIKNSFLSEYLALENNKMKAKLEANKLKTDFTVNKVEKTKGDELFESMIAKFKGKVIYVDFWATWCGPCRSGIKEIAPLKEEMKNQDVVFLYITNESSPENTWTNSIPEIKGEHYRVSPDEWNYLRGKFNISGIPHYVLVNKEGEVVNPHLVHYSNESLKKILEEQM